MSPQPEVQTLIQETEYTASTVRLQFRQSRYCYIGDHLYCDVKLKRDSDRSIAIDRSIPASLSEISMLGCEASACFYYSLPAISTLSLKKEQGAVPYPSNLNHVFPGVAEAAQSLCSNWRRTV